MKTVVVDKIASVAQHNSLAENVRLSAQIPCEEGVLIAARVLNNKSRYNKLELTSGRMASVTAGDVVVGALGHRNALRGYSGRLPEKLAVGDTVQLLGSFTMDSGIAHTSTTLSEGVLEIKGDFTHERK